MSSLVVVGLGKFTSAKTVYEGSFKCGKMHGNGKMILVNGEEYEGGWEDNLKQGIFLLDPPYSFTMFIWDS